MILYVIIIAQLQISVNINMQHFRKGEARKLSKKRSADIFSKFFEIPENL